MNLSSFYFHTADSLLLFFIFVLLVLLVPNFWALKESPHWLVKQGRTAEACQVLREISRVNGTSVTSEEYIDSLENKYEQDEMDKPGYRSAKNDTIDKLKSIFDSKENLQTLIILSFVNSAMYCMYYGISTSIQDLGFDRMQFNGLVSGTIQGIGYVLVIPFIATVEKKRAILLLQSALLSFSGALFILSILPNLYLFKLLQALIANILISCCISGLFSFVYLTNVECFPTQIRGVCVGTVMLVGKIIGSTAPYISHQSKELGIHVLAGCAMPMIFSTLLTLGLKEPSHKKEQIENESGKA